MACLSARLTGMIPTLRAQLTRVISALGCSSNDLNINNNNNDNTNNNLNNNNNNNYNNNNIDNSNNNNKNLNMELGSKLEYKYTNLKKGINCKFCRGFIP